MKSNFGISVLVRFAGLCGREDAWYPLGSVTPRSLALDGTAGRYSKQSQVGWKSRLLINSLFSSGKLLSECRVVAMLDLQLLIDPDAGFLLSDGYPGVGIRIGHWSSSTVNQIFDDI